MFTQDEVQIIEGINQIPIFNIENVRGKCIITPNGNPQSLVLADDIAREGGLTRIKTYYNRPRKSSQTNDNHNFENVGQFLSPHFCGDKNSESCESIIIPQEYLQLYEIMWDRLNQYVNDSIVSIQKYNPSILQYLPLPIKSGSYIPLEVALILLMRLNSKKARDFQIILASKIAPELTKHAIQVYQQQLLEYQQQLQMQQEQLQYYQNFVDTSTVYSTTEIAREFEMSPQQLRKILQELDVIRPCNKTWQVSARFIHCDYVRNKAINNVNVNDHPYWTDGGRQFVIHMLKKYNFIPNQDNGKKIIPLVLSIDQLL